MLTARRAVAWVLIIVAITASGCRRHTTKEPEANVINEEVPVQFKVKVRGDLKVDIDGKFPSKYIAIRTTGKGLEIFGLRPADALRYQSAALVPGLTLTPYRGDGTYVVAPFEMPPPGSQPDNKPKSAVTFMWWPDGNIAADPVQFVRNLVACTATVSKNGTVGTVKCPKLRAPTGDRTVSLDIRWKAPKLGLTNTTTTVPPGGASTTSPSPSPSSSTP